MATAITNTPVTNFSLTGGGAIDWWKYGVTAGEYETSARNAVTRAIHGAYTIVPGYNGEKTSQSTFQWSNGTPIVSGSANAVALSCQETVASGWDITFDAVPSQRTFTLYFSVYSCTARITTHISDASHADIVDTVIAGASTEVTSKLVVTVQSTAATAVVSIHAEIISLPGGAAPYIAIAAATLG